MSTVIYLDLSCRRLDVFVASATETEFGGIVLRAAFRLGCLAELGELGELPHPLLVGRRTYAAQSSAGFTALDGWLPHFRHHGNVVAKLGFQPGGLRVLRRPEEIYLLPKGCRIITPESDIRSNSRQTDALLDGAKLLAQLNRPNLVVSEGQSDTASIWEIRLPDEGELPSFPEEHSRHCELSAMTTHYLYDSRGG